MENFGFLRVAAATPVVKLADPASNTKKIIELTQKAMDAGVSLVAFPELSLTGYTCGDLFGQKELLDAAEAGVAEIMDFSAGKKIVIVVGVPVAHRGCLYNCAAVISDGLLRGLVPKTAIPNYSEFYETRWFTGGAQVDDARLYAGCACEISPNLLCEIGSWTFCCEVCEDLWTAVPPSSYHCLNGALLTVNLSASNEIIGKQEYRRELVAQQSARAMCGYIYCSAGFGESTQDLVFGGSSMIYEYGTKLCENERFQMRDSMIIADIDCEKLLTLRQKSNTWAASASALPDDLKQLSLVPTGAPEGFDFDPSDLDMDLKAQIDNQLEKTFGVKFEDDGSTDFNKKLYRRVDPHPFVPGGKEQDRRCTEILSIQVLGLATRLSAIGCRTAVIGISGGLDSSLALLVTVLAADRCGWSRDRIIGVTMPGYGTTGRTRTNSEELMEALGITSRKISITAACDQHFKDIGHDPKVHDITYENSQARERTQILMDIANQTGGIVIGTGDLSELALGWATYNGDHMSMYGVNSSIPKTLVRHLIKWAADNHFNGQNTASGRSIHEILMDIIDTPISPELLPADKDGKIAQKSEDTVGPYELHDFFLYYFFRFGFSPKKILFLACKAFGADTASPVYDRDTIAHWLKVFLRRFFAQQFKRSCLPDGPKVGSVSLSPRGDWRMPTDAKPGAFLDF
ncbi:MAG: NAD(+) synthase [Bacteroidales bacterium]|nr:NAD(+) synthase [Bacteroidales bacterium]